MKKIITSALLIIGLSGAAFSSITPPIPDIGNLRATPPIPDIGNLRATPPIPDIGNLR